MSTITVPGAAAASRPSGPATQAFTSVGPGSSIRMIRACRVTSDSVGAIDTPSAAAFSMQAGLTSYASTGYPPSMTLTATVRPMTPMPIRPMVSMHALPGGGV